MTDPGAYIFRLTVRDAADQASDDMQLFVQFTTPTGPEPVVALMAPDDAARLTGPTIVVGTAQSDTLASWQLEYRLDGETEYTRFAAGTTSVVAGALGTLDPTMLLNGIYEVRLTATDTGGRIRRVVAPRRSCATTRRSGRSRCRSSISTCPSPACPCA